jgi:fructose-1,6-bisphosphatase/inositol monophosphatase family enzyme
MRDPQALLAAILDLHAEVRDEIVAAAERRSLESMASVDRDGAGDTIYAIDTIGESIVERFAAALARDRAFVMVAEGLPGGRRVYPEGADAAAADCWIVVDPIDGTRGLMYQKRSGWILTAAASTRGGAPSLRDIELAVQTEIPLVKQHLADQLWALRGRGAHARRYNRLTGAHAALPLRPSSATSIAHGYATITRFFPGARDELAAIDDAIVRGALGPHAAGKTHCFEDQYASTGGQLYELIAGHDRFIADLRPLLRPLLASRGLPPALACHPYDICCALIAEESGVIVTDADGQPLDAPLDVDAEVAWAGYANNAVRAQIEPLLQTALRERGWRRAD